MDRAIAWPHPHLTSRSEAEYQRLIAIDPAKVVFVFGSNLAGRHGGGAAHHAAHHFGAEPGKGYGWHGRSYAVPTMDVALRTLPLTIVWGHVARFLHLAASEPDFTFYVTALGTGIAGIPHSVMAPLFADRTDNVLLPPEWLLILAHPEPLTPTTESGATA